MGRLAGGVFAAFDDDDFRWWIGRQADAGDASGVHRTMGHRDRQDVNSWFAARDERNEVGDYASDLDRAWELADAAAHSAETVGLQCRYALLRALLGDLGSRYQPNLAALLVLHRVWTREQALAWGRLSRDAQSALDLIADAIDQAEGIRREELLSLAVVTSTRMGSPDDRTLRLARMARTASPHEQAALLDSIAADTNSGARLGGLLAIIPHLPAGLLPRARAAARAFESADLCAEALTAVARALPPDEQRDGYAEVFTAAREELARTPAARSTGTPGVSLLERLAGTLPTDLLDRLLDLAREADLTGYDLHRVIAAVSCRVAETDPAAAVRNAESLRTGPRDHVLAAAAQAYAGAGRIAEAIAATSMIKAELIPAPTLVAIATHVPDIENPALLEQVRRLPSHHQIEVLRVLAARARRPAPALLAVAKAVPGPRDRLRAQAAIASALTPADIAATLAALTGADAAPDAGALAELASHLTAAQARTACDALTDPNLVGGWGAVTALAVRLADLGSPDEALARVINTADPTQLNLPEALATLAPHLPERLLPAAQAAVQPSAAAEERVTARTALLAHLPAGRAADVIAQAAALDHPAHRARALAPLVGAGHTEAEALLTAALRDTYASDHLDRHKIALQAVRTVATADVELSRQFVAAVLQLPSPRYRLLALLALACSGQTPAARTASAAVVDLVLAGQWISGVTGKTIESAATTCLTEAVLAVPASGAFAMAAANLAPLLRGADRSAILCRADAIDAPLPRLMTLSALSRALPDAAGPIAAAEHAHLGEWSQDPALLPLGLQILLAGGIEPDQELLERAWSAVLNIEDPDHWLACVVTLAGTRGAAVPAALKTDVLDAALRLGPERRWEALTALAPRLGSSDIGRALPLLRQAPNGPWQARAAAGCAVRAAELKDAALMLACLTAAPTLLGHPRPIAIAVDRLPSSVLRTVADQAGQDPDDLAAIAVSAADHDDHQLVLDVLSRISSSTSYEKAVIGVAGRARPFWAETLLAPIRQLWEGPRARALAALIPRVAPGRRASLIEEAVRVAHGYPAPERKPILSSLAPELTRLPPAELARIWADSMHVTSLRGRSEVLVDVATLANPLVEVFGSSVAVAVDDAIQVGGADRWP
jgi:hypothetical protein